MNKAINSITHPPLVEYVLHSVTRLGNLLDFGQIYKAFGTN